ncbi:MAG TPA: PAS domain S-box protein [Prolixibacteraceae bacterium]|nr:PAS domain S-box protein [Prolixibacteraceae bacterium]
MAREALSYTDRFFSYSIDMLCIAGFDGYFKIINPAWEKTLGWTAQELLSRPWNDFVHPDDLEATNLVKSSIAEGQTVFQFENRYRCKDGSFKWLSWNSFPNMEEQRIYSVARDITLLKDAEEKNRCIDWMVNTKETRSKETKKKNYVPEYGNLTLLNKNGLIKQSIDKTLLTDSANDYLSLLETSSAIYEKNGDYALGIFSSGWCQFMDRASRNLCETPENREALSGGKWLCHESCWTDASQKAIDQNKAFDIECNGGIHIYAVPILAGKQVIGAINFGYGDPPSDDETLHLLANKYKVDFTELKKRALSYESRPPFIIGLAKERLHSSARLIGTLIERKMAQDALKESQKSALDTARLLEGVFNAIPDILGIQDAYHRMIRYNEAGYKSLNIKEGSEKNHHCYELIGRSRPCKDCATSIVLKTKKAAQIEKYVPEWDTWFEARSYPILDEKGNITLIIEHLRDITQRKNRKKPSTP